MRTLFFAFKGNRSEKVLNELKVEYKYYLESRYESVQALLLYINEYEPQHIVGLGSYSGKDQDKIRIETKAKNKFRNSKINSGPKELNLNNYIIPNKSSKFGENMGNSYCNLISYLISQQFPEIKYSFLHLPKNMRVESLISSSAPFFPDDMSC